MFGIILLHPREFVYLFLPPGGELDKKLKNIFMGLPGGKGCKQLELTDYTIDDNTMCSQTAFFLTTDCNSSSDKNKH